MSDAIKIDSKLFQERISHFINAWKADKRSGDALFGGASSIVVMMGKVEEVQNFNKNNAMHVCILLSPLCQHRALMLTSLSRSVLAARLRVPHHPDALHHRDSLHSHHCQERCATLPTLPHRCDRRIALTLLLAKYLDQIKTDRFPVEVLVRGKDAEENEKLFVKVADTIKQAGVSHYPK